MFFLILPICAFFASVTKQFNIVVLYCVPNGQWIGSNRSGKGKNVD